jgi:hypothetical protein
MSLIIRFYKTIHVLDGPRNSFFGKEKSNKIISDDETLASSIKQSTQQRGEGRTKREDPSLRHTSKTQTRSQRGKGTNNVPESPPVTRHMHYKCL